jgi:nucleoside 2-deoxyribosyltransferase
MKVYVATSLQNKTEARALMEILREAGHVVTHDWTLEEVQPDWSEQYAADYLQRCGAQDFAGVVKADALVLINHEASRDAMAEFGIALGKGIPVFVLHAERRGSVFFHRATLTSGIDQLLAALAAPRMGMRPCKCGGK